LSEREFRALRFQGPLKIWSWPILNAFLEILLRFRSGRFGGSSSLKTTAKNIEKVTWTDYKGKKRTLIIEREVKES